MNDFKYFEILWAYGVHIKNFFWQLITVDGCTSTLLLQSTSDNNILEQDTT